MDCSGLLPDLTRTHHMLVPMLRLWHKEFLRAAADLKASKHALHYVQLLPPQFTDARVYNMVITACVAACDLPAALEAAEHLRASGRKPDTILYTNLITGALSDPASSSTRCRLLHILNIRILPLDSNAGASWRTLHAPMATQHRLTLCSSLSCCTLHLEECCSRFPAQAAGYGCVWVTKQARGAPV